MAFLITEIEAAELIGGYFAEGDDSIKRRRIRKLMKTADIMYLEQSRERSFDREDLPKLMEGIEWQSNRIKGKTPPIGGCEAHTKAFMSSNLQEFFTPIEQDLRGM